MVAQPSQPKFMSVDEWRELERHSHDIKHEYIDGQVYAMAGGSRAHGRISSNAVRTLEVLSDSTEAYNRGEKFALYRACPTVQEYVLVATKYQAVEVFHRTLKGWEYQAY